ncbi:VOC family protein [Gordonia soli]|uniref:VOC domain-containing protein n=1 Tax=Gordonia soli NBRC 108243 TaxID=1223545 RepID=M0QR56_9ACTN|nr:VOC family protein [Gordonia soli]GAC69912.1 hypothetical protein GS4_29_00110 [Gordonia soli NBRC 108243]
MRFASVRVITDDVEAMAAFYEDLTGVTARRWTSDFAEVPVPGGTLAIGGTPTVALFGEGSARPAENRSAIIEFEVDDVDAEFERLRASGRAFVREPTTMPWGNRSLLLRDPDGTLVNLFTPISAEARARQTT